MTSCDLGTKKARDGVLVVIKEASLRPRPVTLESPLASCASHVTSKLRSNCKHEIDQKNAAKQ